MSCTPVAFKVRFPEFSATDDARIQLFLDDAVGFMGSDNGRWCGNYDPAQCYLAAHFLVLGNKQASGDSSPNAPVIEKEVDDVTIKRAIDPVTPVEGEFGSTSYGKRYLGYRKICFGAFMIGV